MILMAKYFYLERIASEEEYKRATITERFCDRAALSGHLGAATGSIYSPV